MVVDALPLFEATANFISALDAFAECEQTALRAVSAAAVPALGPATAVASAASAVVPASAVALAAGHSVRHPVDYSRVRMTVQS